MNDLHDMAEYIQPGGFILIGRGHGTEQEEQALEQSNKRAMGTVFASIDIGQGYKAMMHQQFKEGNQKHRYGWDLYGVRKLSHETPS